VRISDFTLRNLRTFCAVVEHGGFLGAQMALGTGQSLISAHVKEIEQSLGFRLCRRGRAGFALTEKGGEVYARAKEMLACVEHCEARIEELRHSLSGQLRIGLVDGASANPDIPMHAAVRRFFSRDQNVRLAFEVGTPEMLEKALLVGDVQLAVSPFPNRLPELDYVPVYKEEHGLFCGRLHPLFEVSDERLGIAELSRHAMTVRPYLRRADLAGWEAPRVIATISNMEAQAVLISSGCFLGFLPTHFAQHWVERGEMRRISLPSLGWRSTFFAATRRQPNPPQIVSVFLQDVLESFRLSACPRSF
jgi:LysR family transcriptional regulator, transcriptional activator for bauABCD operon